MQRHQYKRVQISKDVWLKSGLEEAIHIFLTGKDIKFTYEGMKISFSQPTTKKTYTPDFPIKKSFIIESKGSFNSADRKKHRLIKAQHPELDIRFIFQNAANKLSKRSETTYADWCDRHKFKWSQGKVPRQWLKKQK